MDSSLFYRMIDGFVSEVNMPDVSNIGNNAFAACYNLTSVEFPACTNISSYAFNGCSALTTVSFPACRTIGHEAFESCAFTTVDLPACTSIGGYTFNYCHHLISLYLTGSLVCSLDNSYAFSYTPINGWNVYAGQYGSIYVPASLLASYKAKTNWTYFSSRFVGI